MTFAPRPTRAAGVSEHGGRRLKRYEITVDGAAVDPDVIAAAARILDASARAEDVRAVGFAVLHVGLDAVWLLSAHWRDDILHQTMHSAPLDSPTELVPVTTGGPVGCVWELAVHAHERDAWIRHGLEPEAGPDLDAYLADVMVASPDETRRQVEEFNARWRGGDAEALMEVMTEEPVYRASTGESPGTEHRGADEVREAFRDVIAAEAAGGPPPARVTEVLSFGDRALSTWSYRASGGEIVEGIDLWTFAAGRIAVKDAYRKAFPDVRPG